MFQTPETPNLDRSDHIWARFGDWFKCVSCGATTPRPPSCPTPENWTPQRYEILTEVDREIARRTRERQIFPSP